MNTQTLKTLLGGASAILIVSACCWLPAMLFAIGGVTGIAGIKIGLNAISILFLFLGI